MIDAHCRRAGKLVPHLGTAPDAKARKVVIREIIAAHAACPGGTWCDCAHKIPPIPQEEPRAVVELGGWCELQSYPLVRTGPG